MKSGSYASFVSAGAMGADYGVPDDDPPNPNQRVEEIKTRLREIEPKLRRVNWDLLDRRYNLRVEYQALVAELTVLDKAGVPW